MDFQKEHHAVNILPWAEDIQQSHVGHQQVMQQAHAVEWTGQV